MSNKQTRRIPRNFLKKVIMVVASGVLLSMIWGLYLTTTVVSAAPEKSITITAVWLGGQQNTLMTELTRLFEETHPNVKFEPTMMGEEQLLTTTLLLMSDPAAPDIMWINYDTGNVHRLAKEYAIENLDRFYEKYGWWKILPEGYRSHEINGDMYNLSFAFFYTPMIFYNKTIFKKVGASEPKSLEEFYTLCDKLRSEGYEPLSFAGRSLGRCIDMYGCLAIRTVPLEDYNKILNLSTKEHYLGDYPGFTEAFDIMREMREKKAFATGAMDMDGPAAQQLFLTRRAAMHVDGSWAIDTLREGLGDDLDFFLFPQIKKDIPIALTLFYGDEFALSAFAKPEVKDMVGEFFNFVLSKEAQMAQLKIRATITPRADFTEAELKGVADPCAIKAIRMLDSGKYPVTDELPTFWGTELFSAVRSGVQEVLVGVKTPKQMIEEIDKLAVEIRAAK